MPELVGVFMYPGATQLARIPLGPTSWARLFINPITPCLVMSVSVLISISFQISKQYFCSGTPSQSGLDKEGIRRLGL